jgi:23S rRNA-intervening sequence protein
MQDTKTQSEARRPARTFRDLVVWQRAHQLVLAVYRFTAGFPKEETYGLVFRCDGLRSRFQPISWKVFGSEAQPTRLVS